MIRSSQSWIFFFLALERNLKSPAETDCITAKEVNSSLHSSTEKSFYSLRYLYLYLEYSVISNQKANGVVWAFISDANV